MAVLITSFVRIAKLLSTTSSSEDLRKGNVDKRKHVGGKAGAAVAKDSKLAAVQVIFHARIGQVSSYRCFQERQVCLRVTFPLLPLVFPSLGTRESSPPAGGH